MTEKKSGLFVNLVKKAVGLPTESSSCCGSVQVSTESACCSPAQPKAETAPKASAGGCCGRQ